MDIIRERREFQKNRKIYESALLKFHGVGDNDVYNCSIPFAWEGKRYLFGRVERREDFANSTAWLFEEVGKDEFAPVPHSMIYPLEDPFITRIHGEMVMGGTHVRKSRGEIDAFYGYFYRGTDPRNLTQFTCGPANMKDIRLIEMQDGRIGVFSRPRNERVEQEYGSGSVICFTILDDLLDLDARTVNEAAVIPDLLGRGEWGGCNQCYLLRDGRIGIIGHQSYKEAADAGVMLVYVNISFIFDPVTRRVSDHKIIGDKTCYPATECMRPDLADCAFTSGIVMRPDGKADLYSGLGDVAEGRVTIDAPFGNLLSV